MVAQDLQEASRLGARQAIIASDTSQHFPDSILALEFGMDLLVEKPMACNAQEAILLYQRALDKKKEIAVGCIFRFSKSLQNFRKLLSEIGPVYKVEIACQSFLPDWRSERDYQKSYAARKNEGGVLRDLIHEIDYATWIFGWPKSLQARLRNLGQLQIESEEIADLWWETEDKILVSLTLDYLAKPTRRKMLAFGKNGTLEWDGVEGKNILSLGREEPKIFHFAQERDELFMDQAKAFLKLDLKQKCALGPEGIKALALCDTARMASQKNRESAIDYLI